MSSRSRGAGALVALVALFTAGYLAPYLLPTVVGRLSAGLGLTPAQAGLVGSVLLLGSSTAGFTLAARGERIGPRRAARAGLLAMVVGYGSAAATGAVPLVVAGAVLGGLGSGTATAVAAAGIAGQRDPHRASTLGLLSVSAAAGALYLTLPHLGTGHAPPLLAIACAAALVWPVTGRLAGGTRARAGREPVAASVAGPLPYRRAGAVLAGGILCWSLAQNALWGVSGRIGTTQAGLSEVTVGAVFAAALGAGLAGVTAAGALGSRLGRAMPIGAGTVVIAGCVLLSSAAGDLVSFAAGEILWNAVYPVVLSYLLGLAASLDPRGRWAVLVGSASSLGVACGPVTGSLLSEGAGYPGMGAVLCGLLLLVAVPMTAVARHASGRPLVPGSVRRRGGAPAAVLAGSASATPSLVPQVGAPEQPVASIRVPVAAGRRRLTKSTFGLARPSDRG
ncbi:MFS transporter [Streptomyces cinereoruber]|uniref:MFS transporter n=1 Tax=Streptomyces cinereoruber TaxID=67260 RepID=A0AAV4KMK7_9ACTN|nr:MFS transporter [Streptomyces cinereoruber]MBB4156239.1 MFS family permease [Streptomyces cinereoruber]MBY8815911.1 MFS transporter [Streptomyces cinereoruber]NIH65050.1 MFS family permease [Streptomyces cinereoruber]QEV32703.1 MFS transporter [Streptomyces cinereoruber]GGR40383.1 MFS transporter [Streptomyces cinereoruber]